MVNWHPIGVQDGGGSGGSVDPPPQIRADLYMTFIRAKDNTFV